MARLLQPSTLGGGDGWAVGSGGMTLTRLVATTGRSDLFVLEVS